MKDLSSVGRKACSQSSAPTDTPSEPACLPGTQSSMWKPASAGTHLGTHLCTHTHTSACVDSCPQEPRGSPTAAHHVYSACSGMRELAPVCAGSHTTVNKP